ncbi:protein phosphatase 1F isoform X1 [Carcharodon carcharias]|uniref:protein phosphatase 1F isoform X1 n=1 Tax=Carcharodon carcharias TaxID=13397 RepID=UPI001B7DF80C|nr:protein phosphatase 1F isoform X1 [Carcharodon carcharias]
MTATLEKGWPVVAPDDKEVQRLLDFFVQEFPTPLGPDDSLPVRLQSPKLSWEEVEGECAEMGRKLLRDRNLPPVLAATLIHAAIAHVLQLDIPTFRDKKEPGQDAEELVLLEGEPVARSFFNKLLGVCYEWMKELQLLHLPKQYLKVSSYAIRNTRRKMEDRHVALPELNALFGIKDAKERAYFAVFDGHGGVDAAVYAATHLHVNLVHQEVFSTQPDEALRRAFKQTDEMFLQRAKRKKLRSGTTGVAALIIGDLLHVAWLGDSQVMMVRQGLVMTLMDPHKPENESEKQRIEDLGGCVVFLGCWRVNGTLAVSRAIGDIDQKPYISGDADSASFKLDGTEDYIVLACDGFFDGIEPSKVVDLVQEHLQENAGDGSTVAETLVAAAKEGGSSDNITVVLVFLRDPQDILKVSNLHMSIESTDHNTGCPQARGDSEISPLQMTTSTVNKDSQAEGQTC